MNKQHVSSCMPCVVKLSGGRSSGMMLLNLLKRRQLQANRGDVVIFNNTSAEHSSTYEFVYELKQLAEQQGVPFLWLEFCTYEELGRHGVYQRYPTYRVVNSQPVSEANPNGYRHHGEVFEEMISYTGTLPNVMARTCTKYLKIFTTNAFLSDWWGNGLSSQRLGHDEGESGMTDSDIIKFHKLNNGKVPDKVLLRKKRFVRECPVVRESQNWRDYTKGNVYEKFDALKSNLYGDQALLYGEKAVEYVSYLGLRSDEYYRFVKVLRRTSIAIKNESANFTLQPTHEQVMAPLIEEGKSNEDVLEFWKSQPFDLKVHKTNLYSNCVFCPLKGKPKLLRIARATKGLHDNGTPETIQWWVRMEKKYQRNLKEEKREPEKAGMKFVGFYGTSNGSVYKELELKATAQVNDVEEVSEEELELDKPCNCTD